MFSSYYFITELSIICFLNEKSSRNFLKNIYFTNAGKIIGESKKLFYKNRANKLELFFQKGSIIDI